MFNSPDKAIKAGMRTEEMETSSVLTPSQGGVIKRRRKTLLLELNGLKAQLRTEGLTAETQRTLEDRVSEVRAERDGLLRKLQGKA